MKPNKLFKSLSMGLAALAVISITSCKDQPDAYESTGGKPSIDFIRPVSVTAKDSILHEATLGNTIVLIGDNLRSIVNMRFNEHEAVLNTSYITDHTLIVTIPREVPQQVTDKIYMATADGDTVTYDFHCIIPGPQVASMSNEWAKVGETVTLLGSYFLDYESSPLTIKFGEDYTLPRSAINKIDENEIVFTMPADVPHEQLIVSSQFGKTTCPIFYCDTRGMLFDFDTPWKDGGEVLGNHGWHDRPILNDEFSLSGNYMQLGDGDAKVPGQDLGWWDDSHFSFEYWPGDWANPESYSGHPRLFDVADFSDPENMSLKFEIMVPADNAWSGSPIQIFWGGTDLITFGDNSNKAYDIYGNQLPGCGNNYFHVQGQLSRALYMPWTAEDDQLYDTDGKWRTVTIPFSEFIYDYDGNKITSSLTSASHFASFSMFVITGAYNDKTAIPAGVNNYPIIKIDNIRVVPNK